mmetsp:Transcript_13798/g.21545  ORF Transcript_13798/g.21545 Transcript_13798/m.21545 type:complete len:124 (+) Transcript_13798:264-635(+)
MYAFFAAFRYDVEGEHNYTQHLDTKLFIFSDEELEMLNWIYLGIEATYLLDFITLFLMEYQTQESHVPVRDIAKTAKRYFQTQMMSDLVPLIPFTEMLHFKYSRLFFLVKCIRINKSFRLLNA